MEEVERKQINIAAGRSDWVALSYELASLGESGRDLFHRCAQLDVSYSFNENEGLFTYALRRGSRTGVGALINRFKRVGVDVAAIRKEIGYTLPNGQISRTLQEYEPTYNFISDDIVKRLQGKRNTFVDFLLTLFTEEQVAAAVERYCIGGDSLQRTIFPNIDQEGRCVGGAVIPYISNGHRDKSKGVSNIHSELRRKDPTFPPQADQVLFGSHLLRLYPSASVGVVEAQKSAVILSIVYPDIIWLATAGKTNFNERMVATIYDRNVVAYPDMDGVQEWTQRAKDLPFKNIRVSDWWRLAAGDKEDICDVVIRSIQEERHPYVIPDIITTHFHTEAVMNLCQTLKLDLVTTEPQQWQPRPPKEKRITIMDRLRKEGRYV
ncbi:MAG: DUF6371 domain-containing protein [Phocaeicola sp.]